MSDVPDKTEGVAARSASRVAGAAPFGGQVPAVAMTGIVKRFPGVVANDGVTFSARVGEVHALLGENGAGKSTLSNILTGLYRPDAGLIELDGRPVSFATPRAALQAGVGMVHQHFRLVPGFTVAENVVLGAEPGGRSRSATVSLRRRDIERTVANLARQFDVPVDPGARIWQLSVGEQQRVEILKVLARDARVLILDEPTAVLTPQEAQGLFVTLRSLVASGRTVIFISHKLDEVMAVSDRVTVLRAGREVGTVDTAASSARELARMMVGRDVVFAGRRSERRAPTDVVPALTVDSIAATDDRGRIALHNVSFEVGAGEVIGVAGVAGNGQRELAEVLTGMRAATSGTVSVNGRRLRTGSVRDAMVAGVRHVPEDRLHTGLAAGLSVEDNLVLTSYRGPPVSRWHLMRRGFIRSQAESLIPRYDVKTPGPTTPVRLLSGGNVQKVLLAREFSAQPAVLVAASPTRGLDVGAIETVRTHITDAAASGIGIVLISEDLEEILALTDRVIVLYEGRIVGTLDTNTADVESIGMMMGGATV